MAWSFLYRSMCILFQLLALRPRSSEHKEIEILVLRHELAIGAVSWGGRGRAWLTAHYSLR